MPIKKVKSKKSIKHKTKRLSKSNTVPKKNQSIMELINGFTNSFNSNTNYRKSQNNLPARLMRMKSSRQSQIQPPQVFSKSFSKSAVSSFSSVMKNGKVQTHSEGKEVINNSNKPFIEIKEMENGDIQHYMVPKTSIPYKSQHKSSLMSKHIPITNSSTYLPKKFSKVKKSSKAKKSKKSSKAKKSSKVKKVKKVKRTKKTTKSKTNKSSK